MDLDYALTNFCDDLNGDPQGWKCTLASFKELYANYNVDGLDTLTEEEFRQRVIAIGFGELLD